MATSTTDHETTPLVLFRELVEQAHTPMFVVRPTDGFRFTYANAAACRHFARTSEELVGLTICDVDPGATPEGCARFWAEIAQQRNLVFRTSHLRPNGTRVPVEIVASLVRVGDDEVFLAQVDDLTAHDAAERDRKKLEAEVSEAQRFESLVGMAGSVAHDFNNLLVGVMANVGHAAEVVGATSPARPALDDAELAAREAAELCRQLLAYAGRGRFSKEVVDLGALVRDARALLSSAISRRCVLTLRAGGDATPVEAQTVQVRQVLVNLVRNASEALGERGGHVVVRTGEGHLDEATLRDLAAAPDARPGPFAFIEVDDDGPGIDPRIRSRVFEPFVSTRPGGRGLGLAAVLGIARGHRGAVEIVSEADRGTRVVVWFPVAERAVASERPRARATGGLVLVVDDEPVVRRATQRILARGGFDVETAEDGFDALERIEAMPNIACVLLDLTMPGLDGRETLARLRRLRPDLPVILTSGYDATEVDATPSVPRTEAGFLAKPFRPQDLLDAIRSVLVQP